MAKIQDGEYDFVGETIASYRRLGEDDILRFQSILKSADTGETDPSNIASEAASIDPAFGRLVMCLQKAGGLPLLVALLAPYLQYISYIDSNSDQKAILQALQQSNAQQELIIEGMRELIEAQADSPPSASNQANLDHPPRISEASLESRAARRRAWKAERKTSKDHSIKFR